MTYEEMLKLASAEAPGTMQKAVLAMKVAARLDPASTEEIVEDFREIAERVNTHVKTAGIARDVATGLGVTVVGGMGLAIATDLYSATKRGLTKSRNWKRMMEANPGLDDPHAENGVVRQDRLRAAFNSIHRFAPDVASDPLAAGAAVRRLADSPGATYHDNLKSAVDVQKAIGDVRAKQTFNSFLKNPDVKGGDKPPAAGPGYPRTNHPRGGGRP